MIKNLCRKTGQQVIIIHISPNISTSKLNQAMNFGQLIKYSQKKIFPQKSCRKSGRDTSFRPLFFFKKKALNQVNTLVLTYFGRLRLGHTIKRSFVTFQTVDPKICSISSFY